MDTNTLNFWLAVIGVAISVVGIGMAVLIYFLQRTKKSLTYGVTTNTRVVPVQSGMQDRVKILLDGQEVQGVQLLELKVHNNGNVPIKPDDYERPLTFLFGDKAEILSRAVIEKMPEILDPRLVGEQKNEITIEPLLLNKGDWFIVQLLVTKFRAQVTANVRIAGIESITKTAYASEVESKPLPMWLNLLAWLLSVISLSVIPPVAWGNENSVYWGIFMLGILYGGLYAVFLSILNYATGIFRRLWQR